MVVIDTRFTGTLLAAVGGLSGFASGPTSVGAAAVQPFRFQEAWAQAPFKATRSATAAQPGHLKVTSHCILFFPSSPTTFTRDDRDAIAAADTFLERTSLECHC